LDLNPDACTAIREYATANLGTLSIEMMLQYIHKVILPQMNAKERGDDNQPMLETSDGECSQILRRYKLTCICLSTVYRWLKKLGFNYESRKKAIMWMVMREK
jgi:hypothetical protein